ncbi:radical SAM protein [Acetivibrio clariflavus]|uniref:7-carboxy-7-deazaguanine synthase n=1 Tax=Acetivibrio clariflavus (strain DSM 19732 / NBRC 101661 / EBR45) TaxID=720554 RepID=G8LWS0_ACECE|nr:radical SAM protein [Acetivibrio clariflavus]AEV69781.1 organic radical activating enzyme [Acetivibrio clariflavus DSM 19732]
MLVNEIFLSIQGESLSTGFPTVFVRFTGCNLRCSYCDTTYAYEEGESMSPSEIFERIKALDYKRVCITGGEPLLQKDLKELLELLRGYTVTIETNGAVSIENVKLGEGHTWVMDMKTPSSGCSEKMVLDNLKFLRDEDEIKFVIGDRKDYEWAKEIIRNHYTKGTISFSPVYGKMDYEELVNWILSDRLEVRFQIQLHKVIWGADRTGV